MAAVLCISLSAGELLAQDNRVTTANYTLAARFTSAKLRKMVRSEEDGAQHIGQPELAGTQ